MVVFKSLCTRQTSRFTGCDNRRLEALCHFHNRREHVLYIGNPQVQCPGAQYQLRRYRIGQRDDAAIAIHRSQTRTADAIELNALGTLALCQLDKLFFLTHSDNLADQCRQMTVYRDVDIALFQCADIDLRSHAVTDTEQAVCCNGCTDNAGEGKRQTTAQELLHYALPVTVCAAAGLMKCLEHLMIRADRNNIEILPDLLTLCRCTRLNRAVLCRNGTRHIFQQGICQIRSDMLNLSVLGLDTKALGGITNFLLSHNRDVQSAFCRPLEGENDLSRVHTVLRSTGSSGAEQISRNNQIGIRTTDALRAFRGDLTWAHVADLATDTGKAKAALRLLRIKTVKRRINADLLCAKHHLTDCRIRRLLDHVLLGWKSLSIFRNCGHVILNKCVFTVLGLFLMVSLCDDRRDAVLIEADECAMVMNVCRRMMMFVRHRIHAFLVVSI